MVVTAQISLTLHSQSALLPLPLPAFSPLSQGDGVRGKSVTFYMLLRLFSELSGQPEGQK